MAAPEVLAEHACWGGTQGFYRHRAEAVAGPMRVGVFVPPDPPKAGAPALYLLAGLTCTEETFAIKAGSQRLAAKLGLILVTPDTSPREPALPGDRESLDLGQGAGFYVDATQPPWSAHYRMFSYVTEELPAWVERHFPARPDRRGVCGHSMGGHGALVCALRRPDRYRTVSALAPISAPTRCPWGEKAFAAYLGPDRSAWAAYDACELVRRRPFPAPILVDQGEADAFRAEQLRPELFEAACAESGQALRLNRHAGYDHSYWFVQSVVADHLRHHARGLTGADRRGL